MLGRLKALAESAKVLPCPSCPPLLSCCRPTLHNQKARRWQSPLHKQVLHTHAAVVLSQTDIVLLTLKHDCGWQVKLTSVQKVTISLPLENKEGHLIRAELTRGRLDSMAQPLYKRMRQAVDAACWGVCPFACGS